MASVIRGSDNFNSGLAPLETLFKEDRFSRAFILNGSDLEVGQTIIVDGSKYEAGAAIPTGTLASHTDYVITVTGGVLSVEPWDAATGKVVGGFHAYHTTATINPDSIWDIRYRPSCSPRGMTQCPT